MQPTTPLDDITRFVSMSRVPNITFVSILRSSNDGGLYHGSDGVCGGWLIAEGTVIRGLC